MRNQLLSPLERLFVEELRGNTRDKVAYMKLSVLVMLDEGATHETIAVFLGISSGTVSNCKKKYDQDGLDKYLDRHYVPYQGKMSDDQLMLLEAQVSRGIYTTCAQVAEWIKKEFDIEYCESAVRAILTKLDFVYKKTTAVPGKADLAVQEQFMAELKGFITDEATENEAVFFMDAVHPQHNTKSDYVWAKRGEQKLVPTNCGRQRININGAMNAHQPDDIVIVEADQINAQSTIALCQKLLEKHQNKETIYIICDNARYYSSAVFREWLLKNPKIQVLFLPPYSPNLNLIERLWKFLRKRVINLTFYPEFKAFREAILRFFENISEYRDELRTIMRPNFQRFSDILMT